MVTMRPEEHDEWLSAFFAARDQIGDAAAELAERRIARLGDEELRALAAAFELRSDAPGEDLMHAYADTLAERAGRVAEHKRYLRYFVRAVIFDDPVLLYEAVDLAELLFSSELALASALTAAEMAERYGAVRVAERAKALVAEMAKRAALEEARRNKWDLVEAIANAEVRNEGGVFVVVEGGESIGRIVEGDGKMVIELFDLRVELPGLQMDWRSRAELGRFVYDRCEPPGSSKSKWRPSPWASSSRGI